MGYENGKIYKLVCEDGKYYFGSTIRPLKGRLSSHKHASKKTETNNAYNHIKTIGWDNVTIVLVESFPCDTKQQLLEREAWFLHDHEHDTMCLNARNPIIDYTNEEVKQEHKSKCNSYYQQHREDILHKRREYQVENRERRTTYNRDYATKNSENLKDYYKQYAVENRERRNRLARERRARKKLLG